MLEAAELVAKQVQRSPASLSRCTAPSTYSGSQEPKRTSSAVIAEHVCTVHRGTPALEASRRGVASTVDQAH